MTRILEIRSMYFDAIVVFVMKFPTLFKLALAGHTVLNESFTYTSVTSRWWCWYKSGTTLGIHTFRNCMLQQAYPCFLSSEIKINISMTTSDMKTKILFYLFELSEVD